MITEFVSSISNSQIQVIGPELIFGSLYDHIGYKKIDNAMFRYLVLSRLASPVSKLKTIKTQSLKMDVEQSEVLLGV